MSRFLFRGGKFLDPNLKELRDGVELLTEGERIVEVSDTPIKAPGATPVELGGRTLMPGLIDCHVHVYLSEVDIRRMHEMPLSRIALESTRLMRDILDRGFTTVRDTGGADFGVRDAVASGLVVGPRLFIAGRVLGPTGGHGDSRRRTDTSCEFKIRSEVMKPWEIIQSATLIAAKVIRREGELGILKQGAYADLLVVDGDPFKDLGVFDDRGTKLAAIMKGGEFYRNRLNR